ncbi:MAG: hypothetical protein P4L95_09310 [Rouxiella aceris]|uniref:hypothetical protein n=1 Tax=Rouxiella aceris TaxID=2703884 RepID=UPI00284BA5A3|nr:hypothetical protein [Rouxiella aceris]MDR3432082.1 hypothetical protein [Rouxiella aceris]
MHNENANTQLASDLLKSKDFIDSITSLLMPTLSEVLSGAVERAIAMNASVTMSKKDFAAANRISESVLEKWIANGVVLLAPTPTTTVKRTITCKETGIERTDIMEKHGNALINVAAWREKNRQQAVKCRYLKP